MSWFGVPFSKKAIQKEENAITRKYGKVRRLSEQKEYDLMPVPDEQHDDTDDATDKNIDEVADYDDNKD